MPLPPAITDLEQLKSHPAIAKLLSWNPVAVHEARFDRDEISIYIIGDFIRQACVLLRDNPECPFNFLSDVSCVDWLPQEPRFEVVYHLLSISNNFFFQAEDGIRGLTVTGVQTCALPIYGTDAHPRPFAARCRARRGGRRGEGAEHARGGGECAGNDPVRRRNQARQGGPGCGGQPGSAAWRRREDVGYFDPGKRGRPEVARARALEELSARRHAGRVEAPRLGDAAGGQGRLHARAGVLRIQVELEVSRSGSREHQVESESFSGLTDL